MSNSRDSPVPFARASSVDSLAGPGLQHANLSEVVDRVVRFDRTFHPDSGNRAVYDDGYGTWTTVYQRILQLSEEGLLRPMWWPAGA